MKHCCVIGGSGFIGSHVVKLLAATNRKITVIGRKVVHPGELPQNAGYIQGDYADRNFLTCALHGVNEVIDLAYATVPQTSFKNPIYDIFSNLPSAINLFESVIANKVQRLILISSGGTVYGKAIHIPIGEDHVTNPISPYGITKLAVEKYARMYGEINSCPFVCIRPGNAFGEGQEPFVGQGFISTAIASILLQKEIPLFGESGTIRDYIYVEDLAKGILAALEKGKTGSFYNIGTGVGYSNKDILDLLNPMATSAGFDIKIRREPARPFDVPMNILDSAKFFNDSGWKSEVSFETGLKRTWKWLVSLVKNRHFAL